jgi:hypothetical protein
MECQTLCVVCKLLNISQTHSISKPLESKDFIESGWITWNHAVIIISEEVESRDLGAHLFQSTHFETLQVNTTANDPNLQQLKFRGMGNDLKK